MQTVKKEKVSKNIQTQGWRQTYLDSGLDALHFNGFRFPDTIFLHVHRVAGVTVKTPVHVTLDVLSPQTSQHTDGTGTGVLGQCPRDDLHGVGHGLVGPLLDTLDGLGQLAQSDGDGHLQGTTARSQARVEDNVTGHRHGILEVTLDLVEDVLRGATQKDGAGLGRLAFPHEGEVFISDLFDLKQTALGTNVGFLDIVHAVDDRCASGSGNTVVVRLSHTAESCDVGSGKEVLSKV